MNIEPLVGEVPDYNSASQTMLEYIMQSLGVP